MEEIGHVHGTGAVSQMNLEDVSPATRLLEKRRQMFEVGPIRPRPTCEPHRLAGSVRRDFCVHLPSPTPAYTLRP